MLIRVRSSQEFQALYLDHLRIDHRLVKSITFLLALHMRAQWEMYNVSIRSDAVSFVIMIHHDSVFGARPGVFSTGPTAVTSYTLMVYSLASLPEDLSSGSNCIVNGVHFIRYYKSAPDLVGNCQSQVQVNEGQSIWFGNAVCIARWCTPE